MDIACGTGYGCHILIDAGAGSVVGIDYSSEAVQTAAAEVRRRLAFIQGDATCIPLKAASVDLVVSFETLEHLRQDRTFISELRRVLRPGGKLILSTPNAIVSKPVDGRPRNPFHVREYTPAELESLLKVAFSAVEILGQRPHSRFGLCPFWMSSEQLPRSARGRLRTLIWHLQHRMPFGIKDRLSRLLHNRSFYPGEHDFIFGPEARDDAHALVAICVA